MSGDTKETACPASPCVILAGGLAARLGGGDKPMRSIAGRRILDRVIARLEPQCDGLILNANGDPARFESFGLPVVSDSLDGFAGPLAGILAGMDWVAAHRPQARAVLSVSGACPFLPHDLARRLHEARDSENSRITIATSGGRNHPVIALWDVGLRYQLRQALAVDNIRKVTDWIAPFKPVEVNWPVEPFDPFFNVNTPDDLSRAEQISALADLD